MKKHFAFLLALLMALSLAACGAGEKETDGDAATPPATDGSEALTDDAEKEDSEAVTPPKSDGSENLTDEDPNSGIPVPFVAEDFLYLCVELEHQILYSKAYANHAFVIRSCEDLTELLDEINTLIYGDDVFGEELQQKYTADYFEENVLWLVPVYGIERINVPIKSFEKTVSESDGVTYVITVEEFDTGTSDCVVGDGCWVLETKAEADMVQENVVTKRVITVIE